MKIRTGIGQDSHRFEEEKEKPCMIGGICFEGHKGLKGNSDADVVLHALANAISGITGVNILGKIADELCKKGITDSTSYLKEGLTYLNGKEITHVSVSIECKTPKISPRIMEMKTYIASLLNIDVSDIGVTATTGEGLTDFGKGLGIQAFVIVTTQEN